MSVPQAPSSTTIRWSRSSRSASVLVPIRPPPIDWEAPLVRGNIGPSVAGERPVAAPLGLSNRGYRPPIGCTTAVHPMDMLCPQQNRMRSWCGDRETRPMIDERLARRLVDSQFPRWAHLPITPVELNGHDNRTFRLG